MSGVWTSQMERWWKQFDEEGYKYLGILEYDKVKKKGNENGIC